jgi:hypothetical protein
MTDTFRALCAELTDSVELLLEMRAVDAKPMAITEDRLSRARAALAQPEPQGASDEDLLALAQELDDLPVQAPFAFARAVLARWGRPVIEPVPVSERLPGPEDLDHLGTCWMFHPVNFHYCLCLPDPSVHTHWLPHYALPVPQQEVE